MSDFKYEVGDKFRFTDTPGGGREILHRYKGRRGENLYVIQHEDPQDDDAVSDEAYLDRWYTKVVPFFEVGKKYRRRHWGEQKCVNVFEVGGRRWAVLVDEPGDPGLYCNFDAWAEVE